MPDYGNYVWVLWWRYSDGSKQGLIRSYQEEKKARADFVLKKARADFEPMENNIGRNYMLDKIPFFENDDSCL